MIVEYAFGRDAVFEKYCKQRKKKKKTDLY